MIIFSFKPQILRVIGVKIAHLTPSRGFSAEFSSALVVSLASRYGLPGESRPDIFIYVFCRCVNFTRSQTTKRKKEKEKKERCW
jgi:hypothetical protein